MDTVDTTERFEFGANWARFLSTVDEERIAAAETSLRQMLARDSLAGASFLDIGSGSGLFSLAAFRLGADRVHSFDYDAQSVACTAELRRRYADGNSTWRVERGSVLDEAYMTSLGKFDVVYSWGVLHHTGNMWKAIAIAAESVRLGGQFFIAIYNDQGGASRRWLKIKRSYNRIPKILRPILVVAVGTYFQALDAASRLSKLQNPLPALRGKSAKLDRGMSYWHDIVDWVGGYPFEVAGPDVIFKFCKERGFTLDELVVTRGLGCSQYVMTRVR